MKSDKTLVNRNDKLDIFTRVGVKNNVIKWLLAPLIPL